MGMRTSMTNQDLKEIMERMTRMFQAKLKENSSDKIVSVSKTSQVIQRIELLFNSIKLKRTRNYLYSSRMALSNLQVKRLKKYVTGEYIEPEK
jgi:Holliday junction resolvasome RuvABC ATP-dependent DNA helicase subunit